MEILTLSEEAYPDLLKEIPDKPKQLFLQGSPLPKDVILIAVVGSRKYSAYGKQAAETIIKGLSKYNISIVSGLALGIDAIAHRSALENGMHTVAVPGSGLDPKHIYPRSHSGLAHDILKKGGTLLSEFEPTAPIYPSNFPQRNRIMAGMCHATLIIEATQKSGTLITARLALDYNRELFAVPGDIFRESSQGTNTLIRDGASPVQSAEDIIFELNLEKILENDTEEKEFDGLLSFDHSIKKDDFIAQFSSAQEAQIELTKLELQGAIYIEGDTIFRKS